jgi:hypothetical protein
MEKDIVEGNIGAVGSYDLEFKGGKLSALVKIDREVGAGLSIEGSMKVSLDADMVIDALAAAIPGKIDDVALGLIKAALKA